MLLIRHDGLDDDYGGFYDYDTDFWWDFELHFGSHSSLVKLIRERRKLYETNHSNYTTEEYEDVGYTSDNGDEAEEDEEFNNARCNQTFVFCKPVLSGVTIERARYEVTKILHDPLREDFDRSTGYKSTKEMIKRVQSDQEEVLRIAINNTNYRFVVMSHYAFERAVAEKFCGITNLNKIRLVRQAVLKLHERVTDSKGGVWKVQKNFVGPADMLEQIGEDSIVKSNDYVYSRSDIVLGLANKCGKLTVKDNMVYGHKSKKILQKVYD